MAYILISIVTLLVLLGLVWFLFRNRKKSPEPMSTLANISLILIVFGIIGASVLDNSRIFGYSLMGAGVVLAIVDIFIKSKIIKFKNYGRRK